MKNEIIHRVYDFIKEFPPFNYLTKDDLLSIASSVVVKYFPKGSIVFDLGEAPSEYFYVVNTGAIELLENENSIVDVCDEGDVFGIRPLIAQTPYLLKARAQEESVIYAIDIKTFSPLMEKNHKVSLYLATNFAIGTSNMFFKNPKSPTSDVSSIHTELFTVDTSKAPIFIDATKTIKDAASLMVQLNIGSVIICDVEQKPIGIITDKDLRIKVVAGNHDKSEQVENIMSSPVKCVEPHRTLAELQMKMLSQRISHLAITEDGTDQSKLVAVVSEHDLVVQQGDNPAILLKEIAKATTANDLANVRTKMTSLLGKYLEQNMAVSFIAQIISELNDEIIKKCIFFAEEKLGSELYKDIQYCWLSIGSEGRQEQLLVTDQDNAIIFEENPLVPDIKEKCLALAVEVTAMLNKIGYEYCPAEMMASNPLWCQSLEEWKNTFSKWMFQPTEQDIMMCTIFFDFRPVYKKKSLSADLAQYIYSDMEKNDVFIHLLAKNALQNPPPLSFFRNLVLEKNGEHKDSFDIKLRAMMPLADAARVLILQHRLEGENNTLKRFKKLAEMEHNNSELFEMAADAYEILMDARAKNGLLNNDSGRYIKPDDMDKMDRLMLRNAFQPIDQLQQILKVRFQL